MNLLGYYVAALLGGVVVAAVLLATPRRRGGRLESLGRNLAAILVVVLFYLFLAASVGVLARAEAARASILLFKLSSFALDARTLVGFILSILAWRMWRQSVTPRAFTTAQVMASKDDDPVVREEPWLGFTRHWGGLGAGESGWEVEPATARWALSVFLLVALSAMSATMLWKAADDAATGAVGASPAAATPSPGTADGGAANPPDARPADAADGGD